MANDVWFSAQSDIGIQMAELGTLSSSTDSKLIASTLMALKDIVSIEAANSESNFMTGAVENSSYGTFSIKITDYNNLILSYIISADKGSTPSEKFVDLMQALVVNFGKQLTQYGEIVDLAESGAPIPRSAIIQAFLNASTILNMERNLKDKPRELREGYRIIMKDLFNDKEALLGLIASSLGDDWNEYNDWWLYSGILKETKRQNLISLVLLNYNKILRVCK